LKKRTKKLLVQGNAGSTTCDPVSRSFLLLFFKKEVLPSSTFNRRREHVSPAAHRFDQLRVPPVILQLPPQP
jgi:hypothetical protein